MLLTLLHGMLSCSNQKNIMSDKDLAINALEFYTSRRDVMRHF